MAHEYSVQIHDWIIRKMNDVNVNLKSAEEQKNLEKKEYFEGQVAELLFIRQYLTDKIDLDTHTYYR